MGLTMHMIGCEGRHLVKLVSSRNAALIRNLQKSRSGRILPDYELGLELRHGRLREPLVETHLDEVVARNCLPCPANQVALTTQKL